MHSPNYLAWKFFHKASDYQLFDKESDEVATGLFIEGVFGIDEHRVPEYLHNKGFHCEITNSMQNVKLRISTDYDCSDVKVCSFPHKFSLFAILLLGKLKSPFFKVPNRWNEPKI